MSEPKDQSLAPDARATVAGDGGPARAGDAADAKRGGRPPLVLRREISPFTAVFCGLACIATCLLIWYLLTAGENEERIMTSNKLPSPAETWAALDDLWYNGALSRNLLVSLRRVAGGFALAVAIGVPLGVLCGCFPMANAFFAPVMIFGRNIPIAALIPLTFAFFGIGEAQKMVFIFIATVAFIVGDTARAIGDVSERYLDTAYTLGANNRQAIFKVLVPLALPSVFNSFRLLFGLAFGYIMLAEIVTMGHAAGGIGSIIQRAQRLGKQEYIILVLMIIPIIALLIDRLLFWVQRELFPHQYGGSGVLRKLVRGLAHVVEDCKSLFVTPRSYADAIVLVQPSTSATSSDSDR
jgi:NitT/TauT family transport system permease protein